MRCMSWHSRAITKAVDLAMARTRTAEADAAREVSFWMKAMLVVSIAAVLGLTLASWSIARNIVRSTSVLIARVEELANGQGDLSARVSIDSGGELGRLAAGINATIAKMETIVERTRLAEEMMLRAEKMNTVAGMAAGMAHEINNPLAGMMQNAELALSRIHPEHPPNRQAAEEAGTTMDAVHAYMNLRGIPTMLEAVRASGERAAGIISNMLQFSRNNPAEHERHDLRHVLDQSIELAASDFDLKKHYDFKNIEIVREYAPDMPDIPCRATEIQQAILNLLKNAAQAMPGRGERNDPPKIIVRAHRDAGQRMHRS